jgi:hypothetical protein
MQSNQLCHACRTSATRACFGNLASEWQRVITRLRLQSICKSSSFSTMNPAAAMPVSLHERCQYTNKQCPNRRMTKRNGQLHRLCVEHRDKANSNHRRWLQTRIHAAKTRTRPRAVLAPVNPTSGATAASSGNKMVADLSESNINHLLLDEDGLNEYLSDLNLTAEEFHSLRVDFANACCSQEG